jgi:hypothetical protein
MRRCLPFQANCHLNRAEAIDLNCWLLSGRVGPSAQGPFAMKSPIGHLHEDLMRGMGLGLAQGFLHGLLPCGKGPGLTEQ